MTGRIAFTRISANRKTGPIPVTMSEPSTCPDACPLKAAGCYAENGPQGRVWKRFARGRGGLDWDTFLSEIRKLPKHQLWRHNVAGDLAGPNSFLDAAALSALVQANKGRRGFTYTHKPIEGQAAYVIARANHDGFTVNLSADTLTEADELAELGIAPVVVILPSEQTTATKTPAGRHVAICPAVLADDVTCASCGVCAIADRKSIIGFPSHGSGKRKASAIARGDG
jgi:ferredoxin